ncbi:MAG: hypothetical protein ACC645_21870 [Pirellulales bacterium]
MSELHIAIHARPEHAASAPAIRFNGKVLTPLAPLAQQTATPFAITFEEAADRLLQLPRLFLEPDGSLVWASTSDGRDWQIDAQLHDLADRLTRVDLSGTCPATAFDQLLSAIGWPSTRLMFQLVREALFIDEQALRDYARDRGAMW